MAYSYRSGRTGGSSPRRAFHARPPRRGAPGKENIHPSRFIKPAKSVEQADYVAINKFSDFAIADLLQTNLVTKGFTTPSPIQDQSIPVALAGKDIIGIANTGTGKTIAFALPVLQRLITNKQSRVLIMAPTRELAQQIEDEIRIVAKTSGLSGAVLIGGTAMGPQLRDLRSNPRIIIGTPGRIKDHLERGSLQISNVDTVVLDEVDRMLDMGFVHDMRHILGKVAPKRQSFFFSATMDAKVRELIGQFANEPVLISVKTGDTTDTVEQNVVTYSSKEQKVDKLHNLLISKDVKALVFDDTQRSVERLSQDLQARGFSADAIHGGKSQGQRQRALKRFVTNEVNVLVATDVAARGIDVSDITHVINYSTPKSYDDYVHRIGRAGRAGRTGYALTFIEERAPTYR